MEFEIIEADSLINGKYDKVLYDKFIEAYEVDEYEVLTPSETKELIATYNTPRRNLQFMLENDPASLYLFLEKLL
jgi:DNA-directed RNA polymerase subunit H (RpoH/RPB5)